MKHLPSLSKLPAPVWRTVPARGLLSTWVQNAPVSSGKVKSAYVTHVFSPNTGGNGGQELWFIAVPQSKFIGETSPIASNVRLHRQAPTGFYSPHPLLALDMMNSPTPVAPGEAGWLIICTKPLGLKATAVSGIFLAKSAHVMAIARTTIGRIDASYTG